MTKKEIIKLKREVKKATGRKMKDIEIEAVGMDFILRNRLCKSNKQKIL